MQNGNENSYDGNDGEDYTAEFDSRITRQVFHSLVDCVKWAKDRSKDFGFKIIKSSKKGDDQYITCACAGSIKDNGSTPKQRQTSSKKTGCKFRGVIKSVDDGPWTIKINHGYHNHAMTLYKEGDSQYTRLDEDDKVVVKEMSDAQCKPKAIIQALQKKYGAHPYIRKAVYNFRQKIGIEESDGRNAAQQFLHLAREGNYFTRHEFEPESGQLIALFWSHPTGRSLLRTYPQVLCIDATYNTNRYHFALVEIIGVTPTNQNFTAAQALLEQENKAGYLWTLECLRELLGKEIEPNAIVTDRELGLIEPIQRVFPCSGHILCMHHIRKMMRAKAITLLKHEKEADKLVWGSVNTMIVSSTEDEFIKNEEAWRIGSEWIPAFVKYMDDTWMPHKEKFVLAWTDKIMHYGNTTTNRVESAHSALKTWFDSCRGGLDTLFKLTDAEITGQIAEVRMKLEWSRSKLLIGYGIAPYKYLLQRVSHKCLKLLKDEKMKPNRCTHAISTTHGLPCKCYLRSLNPADYILPELLDKFWTTLSYGGENGPQLPSQFDMVYLMEELRERDPADHIRVGQLVRADMYPEECNYHEPEIKERKKGRPNKRKGPTGREPSYWEHVNRKFKVGSQDSSHPYTDSTDRNHAAGDGNCGFRCAAQRFHGSESEYRTVRQIMTTEVRTYDTMYSDIYHNEDGRQTAIYRINWTGARCDVNHWMLIDDLYAMAQVYRAIVSLYCYRKNSGTLGSVTFLPWRGDIGEYDRLPEISIIYRHEHFVLGDFGDDHPLPPPHVQWRSFCNPSLLVWEDQLYAERFERYRCLRDMVQ